MSLPPFLRRPGELLIAPRKHSRRPGGQRGFLTLAMSAKKSTRWRAKSVRLYAKALRRSVKLNGRKQAKRRIQHLSRRSTASGHVVRLIAAKKLKISSDGSHSAVCSIRKI